MNELDKLRQMLKDAGIPFEDYKEGYNAYTLQYVHITCEADNWSRNQIIYGRSSDIWWKLDAIWQHGSYGREQGLIELWGSMIDGDPVVATAEEAFAMIQEDWRK